jgi:Ketopantoate reductase PanE/ApbA
MLRATRVVSSTLPGPWRRDAPRSGDIGLHAVATGPTRAKLNRPAGASLLPVCKRHVEKIVRVLIIGRGVVGTIYGWALSKAGIDVTHVVRKEGPGTDTLHLLDLRPGYPKNARVTYAPKTVGQINPSDGFHLVGGLAWPVDRESAERRPIRS